VKYIYLAGPIEGCSRAEIVDWREDMAKHFRRYADGIRTVSPYRAQEAAYEGEPDFAQAIFDKNWYDCQSCDAILAYLPKEINDRRPSIGTLFEIAWFISMRKPIFIVSDDPVCVSHPLIRVNTGWIYDNFEDVKLDIIDLLEY
tara:strand:+ start:1179 stop:1610 length:432 start_codon:yes stop_codon:yes gene_type:complete